MAERRSERVEPAIGGAGKGPLAAVAVLAALAPRAAAGLDCAGRPDLCSRPVSSQVAEPDYAVAHDMVFLGDGYTAAELALYADQVALYVNELKTAAASRAVVPLDPTLFNFHRVDLASATSDVGDADRGDTALGAAATGFTPISYDAAAAAFAAAQNAPDVDTVVVVVNTTAGRAGAAYPTGHTSGGRCAVTRDAAGSGVLPHELGHAIFHLADEYTAYAACWPGTEASILDLANVTGDRSGRKFARAGQIAPYEGALYHSYCVFRPAPTCLMMTTSAGFCAVCANHVRTQVAERRQGDLDAPYVAFTSPRPGQVVSGTVSVSGEAYDSRALAKIELSIDGAVRAMSTTRSLSYTWNTVASSNGPHGLTLVARDGAGRAEQAGVVVSVSNTPDTTPPTVSLTAPAAGAVVAGVQTLAAEARDNVAVGAVHFSVDGVGLARVLSPPYRASWDTRTAAEGSHAVEATAFDLAGNQAASGPVSVVVRNTGPDSTPPVVRIISPPAGTVSDVVPIQVAATDDVAVASVEITIDGLLATTDVAYAWDTRRAANGEHVLGARARDLAGNEGVAPEVRVRVDSDRSEPRARLLSPLDGALVGTAARVDIEATDDIGVVELAAYAGGWLIGTGPGFTWATTGFADGPVVLVAVARDAAGNTGLSAPVVVRVDRTPPRVRVAQPAPASFRDPPDILIDATDENGIAMVVVLVDGEERVTLRSPPYRVSLGDTPTGGHGISARAVDLAGNEAESATVTIQIDPAPPPRGCGCSSGTGIPGLVAALPAALRAWRRCRAAVS